MVSPLTSKMTFVQSPELAERGNFGLEPGQHFLFQFGGYLKVRLDYNIKKKYSLNSRLDLFSNYLDNPQNIDVNWETNLKAKVSEVLSVSLGTHLIYDDEIGIPIDDDGDGEIDRKPAKIQFKQILGVGISYVLNYSPPIKANQE